MERDRINKIFEECDNLDPKEAIQRAVSIGFSYNTAKKYYYEWRRHYMGDDKKPQQKNTEVKKEPQNDLTIKEIYLKGFNGEYRVCKNGIELHAENQAMAFENKQQWEIFKKEFDKVFKYAKEKNILA